MGNRRGPARVFKSVDNRGEPAQNDGMSHDPKLRDLAGRAAERLRGPNVEAVVLTGSVARGVSDAASDLDILVFLREPLSAAEFEAEVAAARASGGSKHDGESGDSFSVFHYVEGRKVDFAFAT